MTPSEWLLSQYDKNKEYLDTLYTDGVFRPMFEIIGDTEGFWYLYGYRHNPLDIEDNDRYI